MLLELIAECLVLLGCPKLNKIIIVFRKSTSCLRFSLSESTDTSGQIFPWKGKITFPVMRSTSFSVGLGRGMASVGDREGHSVFQTLPNPLDGLQNQRLVHGFLNAASLETVCPFLVCESRTLTHSARLLVQMDVEWSHRPWLHTWSWHSVIALSKIINGKLSVLHLQSDSLNFMSKAYRKDPSCILHRAGYQHSFSQRTWPFLSPIYPSTCLKLFWSTECLSQSSTVFSYSEINSSKWKYLTFC